MALEIGKGQSDPLGATPSADGVNFSVFSKSCEAIELLLFDKADDSEPADVIRLNPRQNKTYHYWHIFVRGLKPGQIYGYRALGPFKPEQGLRFDSDKVLLDPYGRSVALPETYSRPAACRPGDNTPYAMKSVVADLGAYDWEGDAPLKRPFSNTVIYEMHVAGFTRHPSSGLAPEKRGTYAGLIEKIPYLQDLGITAVELLPVFEFDQQDCPQGLINYWGYSPVSFFAPHFGYSSRKDPLGCLDEFRDMVKALHKAGIEVILDVVYNHTTEGDERGPTLCFRGLANEVYYILESDRHRYANYSGTGNTLNANQSVVRRLILDSIHYWVTEMHIDGFRFDLASILSRDESGRPMENPPVLEDIESDPRLAGIKLIAEAWDAAGLYQVGTFVGDSWKEWNGKFRDDIRSFLKGDNGTIPRLAARLLASPDIYGHEEREPEQSINFITCHDGFTLNDLVSYDQKHNEANGEENRDGTDDNLSWNCGVEGPTGDPEIERLRTRQAKNFFAVTLLSLGAPMLLMGDELRRTQRGNNNAYCQNNEISWLDWTLLQKNVELHRFVKYLIFNRLHRGTLDEDEDTSLNEVIRRANIQWHGIRLNEPDWNFDSHSLAVSARSQITGTMFHLMLNAHWEDLVFELPPIESRGEGRWHRWIDTYLEPPHDIYDLADAPEIQGSAYLVHQRSIALLLARV